MNKTKAAPDKIANAIPSEAAFFILQSASHTAPRARLMAGTTKSAYKTQERQSFTALPSLFVIKHRFQSYNIFGCTNGAHGARNYELCASRP